MKRSNAQPDAQDRLAGFVSAFRYGDMPADVRTGAKYRVLDWIGSALAGVRETPALVVTGLVREAGGAPQATLIGGGMKVPVVPAVLAWLSTSSLRSVGMEMGKVMFAFIQCETGALFVHITGSDTGRFVAVACNEDAKLGVVRHKISELLPG